MKMKYNLRTILALTLGVIIVNVLISTAKFIINVNKAAKEVHELEPVEEPIINEIICCKKEADWLLIKIAICIVESNMNPKAVNKRHGDGGLYQHLPLSLNGHTREANRLQDSIKFTDACRFDPLRATQIFEIVNFKHNPEKCIEKAIRLHNPGGGKAYRNKVMKEFEMLKSINYTI